MTPQARRTMWVLALDTTTREGSVALLRDDVVIAERGSAPDRGHAERLPGDLAELLAVAGLAPSALDLLAVASGPGGFTGLRIGLATMQGLALALDRPAVGVPSLAALAWRHLDETPDATAAGAWLAASRGEVFAAAYGRVDGGPSWPLVEIAAPGAATPDATLAEWRAVVQPGVAVVGGDADGHVGRLAAAGLRGVAIAPLLATAVARIGQHMHLLGQSGPPHALAPCYVRRPDVEIDRDRRIALATPRA